MTTPTGDPRVADVRARLSAAYQASAGPSDGARAKLDSQNKLYVRDRIALLFDEGSFVEDGTFANVTAGDLPADGVVTGAATIDGRPVALMANDSTVKAGSWGARTVEKIIRIIETAYNSGVPMVY
ncbi:MAG TPA: carboxyl transferase domain-containing protein, partial [Candidatus Lustribacter sp.]|nr:carboxyl transferase domain-containing protein [Candidatus Lustribacter sp.]